jgi:hypothetical protein
MDCYVSYWSEIRDNILETICIKQFNIYMSRCSRSSSRAPMISTKMTASAKPSTYLVYDANSNKLLLTGVNEGKYPSGKKTLRHKYSASVNLHSIFSSKASLLDSGQVTMIPSCCFIFLAPSIQSIMLTTSWRSVRSWVKAYFNCPTRSPFVNFSIAN